jgi:hypothetical protein
MRLVLLAAAAACGKPQSQEQSAPAPKPLPRADAAVVVTADAAAVPDAAPPKPPQIGERSKAAFPELLDQRKRWIFELVEGSSFAKLRPVKRAPRVFAYLAAPEVRDSMEYVWLSTRPDSNQKNVDFSLAPNVSFGIAFDDDGVRHLAAVGAMARVNDKSNIRGFTFPHTVTGPTKIARDVSFGTISIDVTRERLRIADKPQEVLVARAKNFDRRHNETWYEVYAYAPGIGPALLCPNNGPRDLTCLRLIGTDERACVSLATKLCAGKNCDDVLHKLQTDPKTGERRMDTNSERHCMEMLNNPAELELARKTLTQ